MLRNTSVNAELQGPCRVIVAIPPHCIPLHTCTRQRMLDFAYLELDELLGMGTAARVFKGTYRRTAVAVKVFTPPEVTVRTVSARHTPCTFPRGCTVAHPPRDLTDPRTGARCGCTGVNWSMLRNR